MHKTIKRSGYMSELEMFRDNVSYVKVITGVRRCGKSTLLMQFMEKLRRDGISDNDMLMMNFESSKYNSIGNYADLNIYLEDKVPAKGHFYLFLDEIQR